MSTPIALLQMPEIPMEHILEYLDFTSILVLRKVCHDLRNFVDDTKPASHLTGIDVFVKSGCINFSVYFDRSITGISKRIETDIYYEQNGERCIVKKFDEEYEEIKRTTMEDEDFVTVFIQDFDIILRHQKTVLEEFRIYFNSSNSPVNEKVLESVNKSFKSVNHPIQVKKLYMLMSNHDYILSILPYIDPKPLEQISICGSPGSDNVLLNLNEVYQLEQWKQAKRR